MENISVLRGRAAIALVAAAVSFSASAADYNWTGGAGNCLWSDSGNWTNELGEAVAPADDTSKGYSYWFPADGTPILVTNDINGTVVAKSLVIERIGDGETEIKFVSLPHVSGDASTGWADKEKYIFDFLATGTMDIPAGVTLVLNTDAGRWVNGDFIKNGEGKVVFDHIRSPGTERTLVINAGTAEVAATSADYSKFHVKLSGSDPANVPVFIDRKDGDTLGALDTQRGGGTAQLEGTTFKVGAQAMLTGGASILPVVTGAGKLVFQNERVAKLQELSPTYGIELDRADFVVPYLGGTAIHWKFDDASNVVRDDDGVGSRMVVAVVPGSPAVVVQDETRGSVLSLAGGAHFKGPDANTWLDEFDPTAGYTLAFWMKPDSNCVTQAKIFFMGKSENGQALAIRLNNSETQNLMVTAWGSNQTPTTGSLRDGWHHLAVTYSGEPNGSANMKLYIDGENIHSWSVSDCNPQKNNLHIGNMSGTAWASAGSSTPFTGLMDDFVLASRCFSSQEIMDLMNNGTVVGNDARVVLGDVTAKSSGALLVGSDALSVKTLSGAALVGGVELAKPGTELVVGANAGATATSFKGRIAGAETTLVKEGSNYSLELGGNASAVTNVVVSAGELAIRRTSKTRRGLVAYYGFEEDDPGLDSSVAAVRLVDTNSTPTALSKVADGISGSALHFPGHAHLQSEGGLPSSIPSGNDSYTISVWIKPTVEAASGTVPVCSWGVNSTRRITMIRFTGTTGMQFGNWDEDMGVSGLTTLTDGSWHHVVAVYDAANTTKRFYFDGVLKGEKTTVGVMNLGTSNPLQIGHCSIDSRIDQFYTGDLDEFMVFDYPWTAEEVTDEFNRVAATQIPVTENIPAPVARWTFDDAENPGADTSANAALTLTADGDVSLESGDAICGKAARFTSSSGYFKLPEFPESIIPSDKAAFTVVVRYRPDTAQHSSTYPSIVRWGLAAADGSFTLGTGISYADSLRTALSTAKTADGFYRTPLGTDRTRWMTVAVAVKSVSSLPNTRYQVFYADGEQVAAPAVWSTKAVAAQDFAIGANYTGGARFYGLIDDVQIYDRVLSGIQVRLIAEQLDASKGQATTGTAVPTSVLTAQPAVTVAEGAKLKVASIETIGNLSGAGVVEVAPLARLNVASSEGFEGSVTGGGLVGFADYAVLDFGDGTTPLLDIDHPIALGTNVTVNANVRRGKPIIARGTSFVGVENLDSWTAVLPGDRKYRFVISQNGTELRLAVPTGLEVRLR